MRPQNEIDPIARRRVQAPGSPALGLLLTALVTAASCFVPLPGSSARAQEAGTEATDPEGAAPTEPKAQSEIEKKRAQSRERALQRQREAKSRKAGAQPAQEKPPSVQYVAPAPAAPQATTTTTTTTTTPAAPTSSGAPQAPAAPAAPAVPQAPAAAGSAPDAPPVPRTPDAMTPQAAVAPESVPPASGTTTIVAPGGVVPVPVQGTTTTTATVVVPESTVATPDSPMIKADPGANELPPPQPVIERGSAQFFNAQSAQRVPAGPLPGDVTFNFENESLQAVVKAILGDVMQENYVIAPGVQGTVTFATAKPISSTQALSVLEMLLAWNSATLVYKDGRYTVLPLAQAVPGNLTPRFGPAGDARGYEVRIVPLRYVAPTEMEKLLQPYARPGAVVRADNARAFLVLAGTRAELQNYLDTIETFDVNWLRGMSVGIFPLERVEAKVVVPELEKVFGDAAGTPLAGMFRFMAIDRLNAVLVITPQQTYLEEAQKWLARLDRGGSEAGAQIYVYYVKNVKAKDLAVNLTDIFGGSRSSGTASAPVGAVVPGIESVEVKTTDSANSPSAKRDAETQRRYEQQRQQQKSDGGISAISSSEIRITAIEESNALLIKATPGEYDAILKAIKRLDEVPLQVHIETRILLVDLTDNLSLGVEWFFENSTSSAGALAYRTQNRGYNSTAPGYNHRDAWHSFAGTVGAAGVKWTFLNEAAEALISSLQTNGNARVLSAPSLVVLNNKKASINVGKQIPVTSTYFNNGVVGVPTDPNNPNTGTNFNTSYVQFRDTGIILDVTPRVNPGGLVFMEIKQEQSTPGDASTAINGNVPVDKRVIDTEIAVQSGQTVLLGGLISDTEQQSKNGVPGLSRIPVIGGLFGTQSRNHQRQELLVLLRPTVIENSVQAQDLSDEYKSRFRGLKPLFLQSEFK